MSLGWTIVCIYLVVLLVFVVLSAQVNRHKKRFEALFTYDVDRVFYEISKNILASKDQIYEYEEALQLLYHDKKRMFTKPVLSYEQQYPKIMENIDYLEKLLQKSIFTDDFRKRLQETYQTLQRIGKILAITYTMTTFWTLGIAKIWTPAHG